MCLKYPLISSKTFSELLVVHLCHRSVTEVSGTDTDHLTPTLLPCCTGVTIKYLLKLSEKWQNHSTAVDDKFDV